MLKTIQLTQDALTKRLTQKLRKWYQKICNQEPGEIEIGFFARNMALAIVIENLSIKEKTRLTSQIYWNLKMKQELKAIIEEVTAVQVSELLSTTTTKHTGSIALLDSMPKSLRDSVKASNTQVKARDLLIKESLTEREFEALELLAEGYNNTEMGEILFISKGTVKTYVHSLLEKIGVEDRTKAAVWALRSGILD